MTKKSFLLSAALCILLLTLFAFSAAAETEGIYTYSIRNDQANITAIDPVSADPITIPDTLGGYPVTGLNANDYLRSCRDIVEEIRIPASVTVIADNAFSVARLARFSVDENNPAYSAAGGVLLNKAQTRLIKCPPYLQETAYTVPDTVTELGNYAFSNAKYLETVILPEGLLTLGDQAFAFTNSIKNIKLPDSLRTITGNCFGYNQAITEMVIPENVTTVNASIFTDCHSLETVIFLGNITNVAIWAFDNNQSLKTVALPAGVTKISSQAFVRCPGIERILFGGTPEQWANVVIEDNNGSFPDAEVIYNFPAAAYKNITVAQNETALTIGGSGDLPGTDTPAYRYWDGAKETTEVLYINGEIGEIGKNAFTDFPNLATVIVNAPGVTVAEGTFANCPNLTTLILLQGGSIPAGAFTDCGGDINVFAAAEQNPTFTGSADEVHYCPVSYAAGVLTYGGALAQDAYSFFDDLSVFCTHYGEITKLQVNSFTFDNVPIYYFDTETGARRRITEPVTNGEIYPQIDTEEGTAAISFNTLCEGIEDGSIRSFYLVINDETHPETEDTQVSIVEEFINSIRRVLRAIVTLLNKLFRLFGIK